ncbi:SUKH-4 family immunity protein [Streptomyces sp. NPDC046977]|uniref:SUKH-4 family immunity protein n=1 Tax=Streptomyces sp. NPDC046977 TaxID=3154703 RepID=UPI0033D93E77
MIAPVTPALLAEVFAPETIVRVPLDRQGDLLVHQDTARFLAEVGLPRAEGLLFELREDLADGLTPLSAHRDVERLVDFEGFTPDLRGWPHLGRAFSSDVVLDGRTGAVHAVNLDTRRIEKVHTDLSGMAYGMYLLERRRPDYDPPEEFPEIDDLIAVAEEIREALSQVDPVPYADGDGVWETVHDEVSGGMW